MKTKFTKQEKDRLQYLHDRYEILEEKVKIKEVELSEVRRERNKVFAEFCHIINPDPLPFDKTYLPYGWG